MAFDYADASLWFGGFWLGAGSNNARGPGFDLFCGGKAASPPGFPHTPGSYSIADLCDLSDPSLNHADFTNAAGVSQNYRLPASLQGTLQVVAASGKLSSDSGAEGDTGSYEIKLDLPQMTLQPDAAGAATLSVSVTGLDQKNSVRWYVSGPVQCK